MNIYEYVKNSPTAITDALGLKSRFSQELKFLLGFGDKRRKSTLLSSMLKESCSELKADCDSKPCIDNLPNNSCKKAANCFEKYTISNEFDDRLNLECAKGIAIATTAGTAQGIINTANGIQDSGIGIANLGGGIWNYTGGLIYDKKFDYLNSPDWSKDLIVKESDFAHGTSKFLGSEGLLTVATAGVNNYRHIHRFRHISKNKIAVKGIYEFTSKTGKRYIGQSLNIPRRIKQHLRSGKIVTKKLKSIHFKKVKGPRLSRQIAEQNRINRLGGIRKLENTRNAISPTRMSKLK